MPSVVQMAYYMCLLLYSRIVTLVQSFLLHCRVICSRRVVDLLRMSVATGVSSGPSVGWASRERIEPIHIGVDHVRHSSGVQQVFIG